MIPSESWTCRHLHRVNRADGMHVGGIVISDKINETENKSANLDSVEVSLSLSLLLLFTIITWIYCSQCRHSRRLPPLERRTRGADNGRLCPASRRRDVDSVVGRYYVDWLSHVRICVLPVCLRQTISCVMIVAQTLTTPGYRGVSSSGAGRSFRSRIG